MTASDTLVRLDDLTVGYGRRAAVHHVCAEVPRGGLVAIVGPNGAGKSTLLKAIAGRIAPMSGRLAWSSATPHISYMPQQEGIERGFPITVGDLAAAGLWRRLGAWGAMTAALRRERDGALEAVGLAGFAGRPIKTLSGGQLQRALFARLILERAEVVVLDEPFAAVDGPTAARLLGVIRDWNAAGCTILAALHDLEMVRQSFPMTLLLARDLVGFGATADVLSADNLARARAMSEAWCGAPAPCPRTGAA